MIDCGYCGHVQDCRHTDPDYTDPQLYLSYAAVTLYVVAIILWVIH